MKKAYKIALIFLTLGLTSLIFVGCNTNNNAQKERSREFLERAKEKNDNPIFSWFADTLQFGIDNGITISGNNFGIGFTDDKNIYDFFNPTDKILEKSFNSMDWIMENDVDALKEHIAHTVYDDVIESNSKVISVLNMYGDVNVSKSQDDKIYINLSLIQTKRIDDLNLKLENLMLKPQLTDDILFLEPTNSIGENYWDYIINELNANGIMLEFNIQVPSSVQELRIYNDFGNVSIKDIESKIITKVTAGSISGDNLSLLDKSSFEIISGMSNNRAIDLSFKELKYANELVMSSIQGYIYLDIPNDIDYYIVVDENLNALINRNDIDSCLDEFIPFDKKECDLTITTNMGNHFLRQLIVE